MSIKKGKGNMAQPIAQERIATFDRACQAGKEIFLERDAKHGSATTSTGVLGATVEIIGGAARLRQLVLKAQDYGSSNRAEVINALNDLHNYANIALIELADNNWSGK
jgi:hypothetical protein